MAAESFARLLTLCIRVLCKANAREQEQKGTEQVETWGDKLFIFGALLRVAAMLPRFAGGSTCIAHATT
eukprot:15306-Amphidinium_carterae.1